MKIKQKDFRQIVENIIKEKFSILFENQDFTATRRLTHSATKVAMDFENEIVKELKLTIPDQMSPELQNAYNNIMSEMQKKICNAVIESLTALQKFPRFQENTTDKNNFKK
jgi:hypothetical protein